MNNLDEEYMKIVAYVDTSQTLAESLQRDIKAGKEYSNETIVALSKFIAATRDITNFLALVEQNRIKLN